VGQIGIDSDLQLWPSGIARYRDEILEITAGDGLRVARRDIVELSARPARAGRLTLQLRYQAGLDTPKHGYWVEPQHEGALQQLVSSVGAA